MFAVQEEVARSIVAAVAPQVELVEIAHARRASPNNDAVRLAWRARGLFNDAINKGQRSLSWKRSSRRSRRSPSILHASLPIRVLGWSHHTCHLYRWGPEAEKVLDAA